MLYMNKLEKWIQTVSVDADQFAHSLTRCDYKCFELAKIATQTKIFGLNLDILKYLIHLELCLHFETLWSDTL